MIVSEAPSKWVILKIDDQSTYKVFGTWGGGYLDGQSWKLNSGIAKVTEDEDNYTNNYKTNKKYYEHYTQNYNRVCARRPENNNRSTLGQ